MSILTRRTAALALSMALLVVACGASTAESSPEQVAAAFDGEVATLGGSSIDLAELRGQDVVLWFWAPW